ncbi:MAG: N(G),N(G)-dimethylarginine dimethylaminohydrolase [Eubacteriaceae bacterium]|nr:N(G),N(G)-dimethylarginine dimethylaminohydrolase [Eubacteriaceae bacterium]
MFTKAIVRTPCRNMVKGITTSAYLGTPDYEKALAQHKAYIRTLESLGLDVTILPANEAFPDSCFVEDPAVVTKECAVITNPKENSRNGEKEEILPAISMFYSEDQIFYIKAPGTFEGGDVMKAGNTFFVGQSARTNEEGIAQFASIMSAFGYKTVAVPLKLVLHLKTGADYMENDTMLLCGEFVDRPEFKDYRKIVISEEEAYATNSLWINGKVIVPEGFPKTMEALEKAGYETVAADTSEFRKIDGGLSCLSLRF